MAIYKNPLKNYRLLGQLTPVFLSPLLLLVLVGNSLLVTLLLVAQVVPEGLVRTWVPRAVLLDDIYPFVHPVNRKLMSIKVKTEIINK